MKGHSPLEKHPDFVNVIGMISVENGNIEIMLSELLCAILDIPREVGQALYLTPKSAMARLEILENVVKARFVAGTEELKYLNSVLARAKSVIGRRHAVMHDAWGVIAATGEVSRRSLPMKLAEPPVAANIADLRQTLADQRQVCNDLIGLTRVIGPAVAKMRQQDKTGEQTPPLPDELKPSPPESPS